MSCLPRRGLAAYGAQNEPDERAVGRADGDFPTSGNHGAPIAVVVALIGLARDLRQSNPMTAGRCACRSLLLLAMLACGRDRVSPADGEIVYRRYCAPCHGITGHGDGPAAAALTPRPPDLTRLTDDADALMRRIDGRETVRAHGSSRMPVWGKVFATGVSGDDPPERRARLHVNAVARYVKSLQRGG